MQRLSKFICRLFGTLPGLMLIAVAWDALIVATLSPLSGPLRPLGIAQLLNLDLSDTTRVGRIIMLYHSLAMPFVAALVYLILDQVPMGAPEEATARRRSIVVPITAGYMLTSLGGMTFAYGGRNWIAHGVYLAGLSLVFFAGVLLAVALWPSRRWAEDRAPWTARPLRSASGTGVSHGHRRSGTPQGSGPSPASPSVPSVRTERRSLRSSALNVGIAQLRCGDCHTLQGRQYAHLGGVPLERLAFFIVAVFTLVSAAIGGAAASFSANGFEAFLAEDIVRVDPKTVFQLAIIAHLHIMLTLIDVAILLVIIRTYRVRGWVHKIALPLTIVGTIVVTFATWSVIGWEGAHKVINVGSAFLLPGAILVAVWGFRQLIRERLGDERASLGRKLAALLNDPVRFGIFFELIFVNFVVTAPGVYVAFHLDTYRLPAWLEVERTALVGHWHILATLSAVMVLFLIADRLGTHGWVRQVVGWGLLLGSALAFVFVNLFMFRQPGQEKMWAVPLFETGIAVSLLALALFVAVSLVGRARNEG